jgi:tetratricopeptide (TPR) repeat protein
MAVANRLGYLNDAEQRQQLVTLTAQIGAPFEAGSLLSRWLDGGQLPRTADTLRLQAALWVQAREPTLAIPALEAALKAHPDRDLYLQLGQLQLDRQHYAASSEALQQGIALGGHSGPAYLALGMAQYQQADIEAAMSAFDQAARFPGSQALAGQWMDYLRSGKAREQALAASTEQLHDDASAPTLTTALVGGTGGEPPIAQASAPASSSSAGGLTPIGAERAGSADGVIPAWTGGLPRSQWPAGFHPGGHLLDPFAGEAPLFTITATNASRYAQWLTPGQQALLARYPDYFMKVYPTHRTVAYPQAIEAATQANIGRARTLAADSLADARLGFPFPQPKTGVEVLWNHRVRYRGDTLSMQSTQAVVWPDGTEDRRRQFELIDFRYANLADPVDLSRQNILLYYLTWFSRAARGGADYVLVHETANQLQNARAIWVIPEGIPRMFRVPPVGYDQPFPGSAGMQFVDMVDMYNGLFDRYVWKLIGKREIYIPYNDYRLSDGSLRISTRRRYATSGIACGWSRRRCDRVTSIASASACSMSTRTAGMSWRSTITITTVNPGVSRKGTCCRITSTRPPTARRS